MSEPAGGGDIPAMGSSPPETEPTTESEPQSEEASRPSEQPSASLPTPEQPPVGSAVEEIPRPSIFSKPVESEAPPVEAPSQERPPTEEYQRQQVGVSKAETPPLQPDQNESSVVATPQDENPTAQTSDLTTLALRVVKERVMARDRLGKPPGSEAEGEAA